MIRLCVQEMALDRGLRQADLIKRGNLSPVTVRNYWHNRVRNVSMDVLEALGAVIGVSGTNLLTDMPLPAKLSSFLPSRLPKPVVDIPETQGAANASPPTEEIGSLQNGERSSQQATDENQPQPKKKLSRKAKKRLKMRLEQEEYQAKQNNIQYERSVSMS